ncbi:hypothetical protein M3685_10725 [Heyndrickxia oleronia]|uniref:DUF6731 family protein n=1 Tax=Heyndrickxia TaxID=2837504 RepID=UPI00203F1F5E|nr:DUF6731 family protein [Heyndrickxia oleronia]MCM3454418.1 hypothetical protein [Heyndrickxia oleronia]
MAKRVRFDYFKVYARSFNEEDNVMEEGLCNISEIISQSREIEVTRRVFSVGDDQARLQNITYNNNKWEMHFLRIRKDNFPLRTHDNGDFGFFDDLTDEEGFGEEVSALYDPENMTIMIRRNSHSLSPSSISDFFTTLINRPGFTVFFKPLVHPRAIELLRREHLIRGAEVAIADVKNASQRTKRSLGNVIRSTEEMDESVNIIFKIGLEPKGSKKSSRIPIYEELEAFANDEKVKKVEVRMKPDEDSKVETVDLIKNRLFDYHLFSDEDINIESRNILHETVISRMHQLYRVRLNDINNIYE